jgi:penicillin-binding protein 1A
MSLFLLKALAVGLTVSQILTQPEVKTSFSPTKDRALVRKILLEGCLRIREVVGEEAPAFKKLDPIQFLDMQIKNAQALGQSTEILPGLQMADAKGAYELFCTDKPATEEGDRILTEMIGFYNLTMYDLPSVSQITSYTLKEYSKVKDVDGKPLTDLYSSSRRRFVALKDIPEKVRHAFLSAEDRHFYKHSGIDERGVLRAGLRNMMSGSNQREQGASTITQQVVKNLLLNGEVSYERKIREMVLASRLEKVMSKDQIFELYLNYVLLGRSSWGVAVAAESYFGKKLADLTIAQAAFLAGMPKGPSFYNPDRNRARSLERTRYVLEQMKRNNFITADEYTKASEEATTAVRIPYSAPNMQGGGHFMAELSLQLKNQLGLDPRETSLSIESSMKPEIQIATERALQEGLAQYELQSGRAKYSGPEANLQKQIEALTAQTPAPVASTETSLAVLKPWQIVLTSYLPKLPDVHWPLAIVLSTNAKQILVGLKDGSTFELRGGPRGALKTLKTYDVVFIRPNPTAKTPKTARATAELRFVPEIQGAVTVMENQTGRIVSLMGGFSYHASNWNRAVNMIRQPGSLAKPLTFLAALTQGLQPNTLVADSSVLLDPVSGRGPSWSPNNYESDDPEILTMRRGLELSRNRVTAKLASEYAMTPAEGLDKILALMKDCGFQQNPIRYWPVILGAQETRMIDVVTCYATIANGGWRPNPHLVRSVSRDGKVLLDDRNKDLEAMVHTTTPAIFQLRSMMQGVVARGTATSLQNQLGAFMKGSVSDYIAGKTGTTQNSNDVWFVGFSPDITVAVWVGYDNSSTNQRRNLGRGTGGSVALPIFAEVWKGTLKTYPPRRFGPPPDAARHQLREFAVDQIGNLYDPAQVQGSDSVTDYIRVDASGQIINTRNRFISEDQLLSPFESELQQEPYESEPEEFQQPLRPPRQLSPGVGERYPSDRYYPTRSYPGPPPPPSSELDREVPLDNLKFRSLRSN